MDIIAKVEAILRECGIVEYKQETKLIILEASKMTLEDIYCNKEIKNQDKILQLAYMRAKTKAPIQHILGYAYFMNEKYIVNKNVLIPRDETELLVHHAYKLIKDKEKLSILELGIGSGCISCALAKLLDKKEIEILGVDISTDAIMTALENINRLNLIRKIILRKSDLFSKIRPQEKFDLIISNPPYIPRSKKDTLDQEVKDFEPPLALFAPDSEGIDFYKRIIKDAPKFLKKNGYLIFELGINQKNAVEKFLKESFYDIDSIKDLAGIDRVIWGKY